MEPIHEMYLPYTSEELARHFIGAGTGQRPGRHTKYYEDSAASAKRLLGRTSRSASGKARGTLETYGFQMQKDERFWVATALMSLYRAKDSVDRFASLLSRGLPASPSHMDWLELLGNPENLELYFEVNLPSPAAYRDELRKNADSVVLLPWLRELARSRPGVRLEGQTKADAILVNGVTGFAAVFEAKVLSDISTHTRFDPARNQIARSVDVLLDRHEGLAPPLTQRLPERTFLFLLTPERFREERETRLYGSLVPKYQADPALLKKHLPHRDLDVLDAMRHRLGWLTWEDCAAVLPSACPWLTQSP